MILINELCTDYTITSSECVYIDAFLRYITSSYGVMEDVVQSGYKLIIMSYPKPFTFPDP